MKGEVNGDACQGLKGCSRYQIQRWYPIMGMQLVLFHLFHPSGSILLHQPCIVPAPTFHPDSILTYPIALRSVLSTLFCLSLPSGGMTPMSCPVASTLITLVSRLKLEHRDLSIYSSLSRYASMQADCIMSTLERAHRFQGSCQW